MLHTPKKVAIVLALLALVAYPVLTLGNEGEPTAARHTHGVGGNDEIQQLQAEIASKQDQLADLQKKQSEYQKLIREQQDRQVDLQGQIEILESSISKMETQLNATEITIDKTTLEIKKVQLEIAASEEDIAKKQLHLQELLRLIAQNDAKDTLEILLVHNSLSDFLDQVEYIKDLNANMSQVLEEVKIVKAELVEQKEDLDKSKEELVRLKEKLEAQRATIAEQKEAKEYTFDESVQSEAEYQRRLRAAKAEQSAANAAIVSAERALRKKMEELKRGGEEPELTLGNGLIWPTPKNVITAYFHDPDYPYRHVFEHPAIDYRAAQGTTVRAAASGYVAKAVDNGYGYSYVMIVHADGLSTVYGHMSRIDVSQDQYVSQAETIGLSGGMPGTAGAGYLTTGPHMHFEVRLNGIPVNPLNYLP